MRANKTSGFTLIEVLIAVAIIALLILAMIVGMTRNRDKADDAKVKSTLQRLKIAFEDYYGDKNCYPPPEWFDSPDDCNKDYLAPYLNAIPCNPKTGYPFPIEYVGAGQCGGFKLYATLKNTNDSAVTNLCVGSGGSDKGNYGVSSENTSVGINCQAFISPAPSSGYPPGQYGCQPMSGCNNYGSQAAAEANCTYTFSDNTCNGLCGNAIYNCN